MKNLKFTFSHVMLFLFICLYPSSTSTEIFIPEDKSTYFSECLNKFQDENLPWEIAEKIVKTDKPMTPEEIQNSLKSYVNAKEKFIQENVSM